VDININLEIPTHVSSYRFHALASYQLQLPSLQSVVHAVRVWTCGSRAAGKLGSVFAIKKSVPLFCSKVCLWYF
jgi:hypothetical protein